MSRRRSILIAAVAAAAILTQAGQASAAISVSTVGDEINISSTNGVLATTVSYQFSGSEIVIGEGGGGAATTSDPDCAVDGSSVVRCDDNGER